MMVLIPLGRYNMSRTCCSFMLILRRFVASNPVSFTFLPPPTSIAFLCECIISKNCAKIANNTNLLRVREYPSKLKSNGEYTNL